MARIDLDALKRALPIVQAEVQATEAEPRGDYRQPDYWTRRREAKAQLTQRLTDQVGARVVERYDMGRVTIAGLSATSTTGVMGALRNWLTAARRRLEAG